MAGFLKRFLGTKTETDSTPVATTAPPSAVVPGAATDSEPHGSATKLANGRDDSLQEVSRGERWGAIEVDGEHLHRAQVARVFTKIGYTEGGVTVQKARLIPESGRRVRVEVLGEPVGYVGESHAEMVANSCARIPFGSVAVIDARIWATPEDGVWRSRVTLEHGAATGSRERDFREERAQAERYEAEREAVAAEKEAARRLREQERAAKQKHEAQAREAGSFDGEHWTTRKLLVPELKKLGRTDDASAMLERCVDAAEAEANVRGEAPEQWPTTQLGMILRGQKDVAAELELLERYASACGEAPVPDRIAAHLNRARLAGEIEQPGAGR
ncbi:hypothetical protein M3693_07080 [Cellulosimicrobium funkei]|uniref:hypothetical protein n=1 Tax=Cellulosimicrobium funkei TaxID=264251 RepID=UPI00203B8A5B|nr:hypothetical protein [Cellulosimicrobium funkei]MCM3533986.1 hypothetical protein [Cellulosimicrobium funkei]